MASARPKTPSILKSLAGIRFIERGWLSANNIFIFNQDELHIVDTSYDSHRAQTLSLVQQHLNQHPQSQCVSIINTHLHSDHCGGNATLQSAFPQIKTYIPQASCEAVKNWDETQLSFIPTGQECSRFQFDQALQVGHQLTLAQRTWDILGAPGHDPDSVILYNAQDGLLISADALWQNGFGTIFPELIGESGFDEVSQTLDLIESLDVQLVLPGHGPAFSDLASSLHTARSRLDYLAQDPKRNAKHAAKVLLKFRLLDWQSIRLDDAQEWIATTPLFSSIGKILGMSLDEIKKWAPRALIETGGARLSGDLLINQN